MRSIGELLDAVKARHTITSDYKLAMFLGIGLGNIRNYRHGRSLPDARMCERIALALDEDPLYLIAEIESQRAANDDAARLWRRMAERLKGGTLGLALLVFVLPLVTYIPESTSSTLIVMSNVIGPVLIAVAARVFWRLFRLTRTTAAA